MHIANNKGETLCLLELGDKVSSWLDLDYTKKNLSNLKNATCEVCIFTFNAAYVTSKNKKPVIFLDMDGVCVDFIGGLCEILNQDREEIYNSKIWEKEDSYNQVGRVFGITETQLWSLIERRGLSFWSRLKPYPWFEDLYQGLELLGDVVFLSTPTSDPFCLSGKLRWLQGEFGKKFKNYIFTPIKDVMKFDNAILIDDKEETIKKIGTENGVLFPQPWNSDRDHLPFNLESFLKTIDIHLQLIIYKENNDE